jgi:hypothetical protein
LPSETCYLNEGQKVLFPAFFMASQLCQKAGKNELSLSWKISGVFWARLLGSNEISVIWAKNTISTEEINNNKKTLHYVWLRFALFKQSFLGNWNLK